MEDGGAVHTAIWGLQLHIVLEQKLELHLMYSSCQICVLGQVIYQCPSLLTKDDDCSGGMLEPVPIPVRAIVCVSSNF